MHLSIPFVFLPPGVYLFLTVHFSCAYTQVYVVNASDTVLLSRGFACRDAFEGHFITTEGKLDFCNAFLSDFPDLERVSCG